MAYDPADPADVAAVQALVDDAKRTVTTALAAAHESKVTELSGKVAAAESLAADLAAAKTDAATARAELAAALADATTTKAERDALKATVQATQKAQDDALIATLPEALRVAASGLTGDDLKARVDLLNATANRAIAGRATGDGAESVASEEMRLWAASKGYGFASDALMIASYNKIGPGKPRLKVVS